MSRKKERLPNWIYEVTKKTDGPHPREKKYEITFGFLRKGFAMVYSCEKARQEAASFVTSFLPPIKREVWLQMLNGTGYLDKVRQLYLVEKFADLPHEVKQFWYVYGPDHPFATVFCDEFSKLIRQGLDYYEAHRRLTELTNKDIETVEKVLRPLPVLPCRRLRTKER